MVTGSCYCSSRPKCKTIPLCQQETATPTASKQSYSKTPTFSQRKVFKQRWLQERKQQSSCQIMQPRNRYETFALRLARLVYKRREACITGSRHLPTLGHSAMPAGLILFVCYGQIIPDQMCPPISGLAILESRQQFTWKMSSVFGGVTRALRLLQESSACMTQHSSAQGKVGYANIFTCN